MKIKCFLLSAFLSSVIACAGQEKFYSNLCKAAIELTKSNVIYDPTYFNIKYPNGDVPVDKGVCTDVIIRAYRKVGIDLQKEVHIDMQTHFKSYPKKWGLKMPHTLEWL